MAAWLAADGHREYDVRVLAGVLAGAVVFAEIAFRTLFSVLKWAENAWQRADQLFDEVSARQIELNQTLKSLELANDLQRRTQYELAVGANRLTRRAA